MKQMWRGWRQGKVTAELIISSIFQAAPRAGCDLFAAPITLQAVTSLVFKINIIQTRKGVILVLTFPANLPFAADIYAFMKLLFFFLSY